MASRTKVDSNFITLVLSVNGRVRPVDLQGVPQAQRAEVLQSFYSSNVGSIPLHFDGEVLVKGVASEIAAPQAPPATPEPVAPVSAYTSVAPQPAPTPPDADFYPMPSSTPADMMPSSQPLATEIDRPAEKVSPLFWLLPMLLSLLGGIIAYFAVRRRNLRTAKAMLVVGIVLTVLYVLAGVAAVTLGMLALPGL